MASFDGINSRLTKFGPHRLLHISGPELNKEELVSFLNSHAKDLNEVRGLRLDLDNIDIVPNEIFMLENLEDLSVSGKRIEGLKNLFLPKSITKFELKCDSIDELPGFLYTSACKTVHIDCDQIDSLADGVIHLSEDDACFSLNIDELQELPLIELPNYHSS